MNNKIIANTADELFDKVCEQLIDVNHDFVAKELINANLVLTNPIKNTMCDCARRMPIQYAIGEMLWYNSKNPKFSAISPYSKFWEKLSDDGETVNSNYGYCIREKFGFDQWEMVKKLLTSDESSRQCVIHIKEARNIVDNPTKDLNCTIALQFLVRDNKLHLITTMRSNDIWLGLPYDLFNFTCMQIQMAMELNLDIGIYYHNAGSLHLYKRDLNKLKGVPNYEHNRL